MTTQYIVFRHGSNSANQPMSAKKAVGTWSALSRDEAVRIASYVVTVYSNQRLTAEPYSRAGRCWQDQADLSDFYGNREA